MSRAAARRRRRSSKWRNGTRYPAVECQRVSKRVRPSAISICDYQRGYSNISIHAEGNQLAKVARQRHQLGKSDRSSAETINQNAEMQVKCADVNLQWRT